MTLPSISVLTHHQSAQVGWFLSRDRGWQAAKRIDPTRYHRIYVDGLCGRELTGEYDALAAMKVLRRSDYGAYVDDLREELADYQRITGRRIDAGVGGYHHLRQWCDFTPGDRLGNMIWTCRRMLMDSDSPPSMARPCRPLVNSFVLDAAGATVNNSDRWFCVETEWRMKLPIGCESRANIGSFFAQPQRLPFCVQYSQDDTARITSDSHWDYLRRFGMKEHSILITDETGNETFVSRWRDAGHHLVYPIAAWERNPSGVV